MKNYLKGMSFFKLEDLHGKTLEMAVGEDEEDGVKCTVLFGIDRSTGIVYHLNTTRKYKGEKE